MKKYLIGFVFALNIITVTPSYAFLDGLSSGLSSISGTINQVGGIVGQVSGIAGSIRSLFGGGGSSSGGGGSFSGFSSTDSARIFSGGAQGGLNIGVDNITSSSTVVVEDFDALFDQLNGTVGVTPTGEFVLPDPEKFNQIGENTSLRQFILNVLNFFLTFLGIVAVAFIIYAGFLYVTSGGDDGNMEKAKKIILYAIIGILVILASFSIVNTIIQNAGRGTDDRNGISNQPGTGGGGVTLPGGGNGTDSGVDVITGSLGNLILVSGAGVQDLGSKAVVDPANAKQGVVFSLGVQGQALIDFGDGTQAVLITENNPTASISHPFGQEKSYPVRAIIQTLEGTVAAQKDIVVGGVDANFSSSRSEATVGEVISLNASSTTVSIGSISEYAWSCAGGTGCFSDTFGQQTEVSFSAPGQYTVTLTATNVLGISDSFSKTISVIGGVPVANFTAQSARNSNKPAEFVFNAGTSVNRAGQNNGLTYFWNFDGEFREINAPTVNYEFNTIGEKTVTLVVVENFRGQTLRSEPYETSVTVDTVIPVDFTVD